ncbi:MAG: hypothetical protein L0322_24160, partial [Chloroflexi bacterium]|nr:hypothetical protein [Chloroflexota bacterium]
MRVVALAGKKEGVFVSQRPQQPIAAAGRKVAFLPIYMGYDLPFQSTTRDGLEESVVHSTNTSKADCAHELGDLCHRDRETRALQDRGAFVSAVCGRDL